MWPGPYGGWDLGECSRKQLTFGVRGQCELRCRDQEMLEGTLGNSEANWVLFTPPNSPSRGGLFSCRPNNITTPVSLFP